MRNQFTGQACFASAWLQRGVIPTGVLVQRPNFLPSLVIGNLLHCEYTLQRGDNSVAESEALPESSLHSPLHDPSCHETFSPVDLRFCTTTLDMSSPNPIIKYIMGKICRARDDCRRFHDWHETGVKCQNGGVAATLFSYSP